MCVQGRLHANRGKSRKETVDEKQGCVIGDQLRDELRRVWGFKPVSAN